MILVDTDVGAVPDRVRPDTKTGSWGFLPLRVVVTMLVLAMPLLVGAPAAQAKADRPEPPTAVGHHPPYPPYPPANCLRHYAHPVRHGWKIELVWLGGRSCPPIFFRPAKVEIWLHYGYSPPPGPWAQGGPAEPAAIYGGHRPADRNQADGEPPAQPAMTWWEKVKVVPVDRHGGWSASVIVDDEGPYTFAAVNSITRQFVLVEIEVWDDSGGSGAAGGTDAAPPAAVATDPVREPADDLLRVGVPAASSALVMGAALLLLRRRARQRQKSST